MASLASLQSFHKVGKSLRILFFHHRHIFEVAIPLCARDRCGCRLPLPVGFQHLLSFVEVKLQGGDLPLKFRIVSLQLTYFCLQALGDIGSCAALRGRQFEERGLRGGDAPDKAITSEEEWAKTEPDSVSAECCGD